MLDDKEYYLRATREFEENNLDEELWAKVIALAGGDEAKAKYDYIIERAKELQSEEFIETKFVPAVKKSVGSYLKPKKLSIYNLDFVIIYFVSMIFSMATMIPVILKRNEDSRHFTEPEGPSGPELVFVFFVIYLLVFVLSHFIAVTYGYIYKYFNKAAVLDEVNRNTMSVVLAIFTAVGFLFWLLFFSQ